MKNINRIKHLDLIKIIISSLLFIVSFFIDNDLLKTIILVVAYIILSYEVLINVINNFKKKTFFDENLLMLIATLGAFIINETHEAVIVMFLYLIGEYIGSLGTTNTKTSVFKLMDLRTNKVNLKVETDIMTVYPTKVKVGDIIVVKPGEVVPLDGVVTKGEAFIDTKSLTGESAPKRVTVLDEILSGTIVTDSVLEIKVMKLFKDSTVSKILDILENSNESKSVTEKFITKFAKVYTPVVVVIAILLFFIPFSAKDHDTIAILYRSLTFLVASCPCSIVISIPLAYFCAIGSASKNKIMIKSSSTLETLKDINLVVFDKTGTLTHGDFVLTKILPLYRTKQDLLIIAAYAEFYSNHPIARAIKREFYQNELNGQINTDLISNFKEIRGKGLTVKVGDTQVIVGSGEYFNELGIQYPKIDFIGTVILIAENGEYVGTIVIADEIKEETVELANDLKLLGVSKTAMLSGDNSEIVKKVATKLEIDESYANLLPTDKVDLIQEYRKQNKVLFIGDGLNDAPVIKCADIGVSMGTIGSDEAVEASDIILMNDDPSLIVKAIILSRRTNSIVTFNIIFSLLIKFIVLILSFMGITNMWFSAFADVGVTIIAVINSIRLLKK